MNILFLCSEGGLAGSTFSISALAKGLAKKGHNVYVGCFPNSLLAEMVEGSGVTVIGITLKGKFNLQNMRQIRDAVKAYNIDVINPQASKDRYVTAFSQWLYRFWPVVVHTRRQRVLSGGGLLQSWFYMSVTDKIVATSHGVKDQLIAKGIKPGHLEVIYNGTPPEKYVLKNPGYIDELKHKYNIQDGDAVVGCISRLKQQDQLIKALALVKQPVKLMLVGISPTPELEMLTQAYVQKHEIIYVGSVSMEEAIYYYKLFTVKVLPSTSEGLSQSLLEAMASGVPVIATDAAGNPDLIKDGENGFLFAENDIQTLAQRITQLINDKTLHQRFSAAGKKTALEEFSLEKTISNYEKFFERLIAAKKAK